MVEKLDTGKDYKCGYCNYTRSRKSLVKEHERTAHNHNLKNILGDIHQ